MCVLYSKDWTKPQAMSKSESGCDVQHQRCDAKVHTTVLRFPLTSDNLMYFGAYDLWQISGSRPNTPCRSVIRATPRNLPDEPTIMSLPFL